MKCTHVRASKRAELDFARFIILSWVNVDGILRILFPVEEKDILNNLYYRKLMSFLSQTSV